MELNQREVRSDIDEGNNHTSQSEQYVMCCWFLHVRMFALGCSVRKCRTRGSQSNLPCC